MGRKAFGRTPGGRPGRGRGFAKYCGVTFIVPVVVKVLLASVPNLPGHCFGAWLKEDNAFYCHSKLTHENSSWAAHQASSESCVTFSNDFSTSKFWRFRISFAVICSQWSCSLTWSAKLSLTQLINYVYHLHKVVQEDEGCQSCLNDYKIRYVNLTTCCTEFVIVNQSLWKYDKSTNLVVSPSSARFSSSLSA